MQRFRAFRRRNAAPPLSVMTETVEKYFLPTESQPQKRGAPFSAITKAVGKYFLLAEGSEEKRKESISETGRNRFRKDKPSERSEGFPFCAESYLFFW